MKRFLRSAASPSPPRERVAQDPPVEVQPGPENVFAALAVLATEARVRHRGVLGEAARNLTAPRRGSSLGRRSRRRCRTAPRAAMRRARRSAK